MSLTTDNPMNPHEGEETESFVCTQRYKYRIIPTTVRNSIIRGNIPHFFKL